MAYKRLTDAYIDIVEGKTDEASIDLLRKKLRKVKGITNCLLYTSPSPRDRQKSRMPSSA